MNEWLTPNIIIGASGALIAALIGAFIALLNARKAMEQQRKQFDQQIELTLKQLAQQKDHFEREHNILREQLERRAIEKEKRNKQTVQAFVDLLRDVRSLNKPPAPSGAKLWNVAYKRLHEVRRRLTETLSLLPVDHVARDHLVLLLEAFHAWADEWDQYGDFADTDTGESKLMDALSNLQDARCKAEDGLRKKMNLPKSERHSVHRKGAGEIQNENEKTQ